MSRLAALRTSAGTLIAAPVIIAVALYFVLPLEYTAPPTWTWATVMGLGLVSMVLVSAVGYRMRAIDPGTSPEEAGRLSVQRFSSALYLRFALTELVAIVGIALAFVVDEGQLLLYLLAAVISLVLMAIHVWPDEMAIGRSERALEAAGAASHLRDALHAPAGR